MGAMLSVKPNTMKKTSNPFKVILFAFVISTIVSVVVMLLESLIGSAEVFLGAVCMIPVTFVLCLFTAESKLNK